MKFTECYFDESFNTKSEYELKNWGEVKEYKFSYDGNNFEVIFRKGDFVDELEDLYELSFNKFKPGKYDEVTYDLTGDTEKPLELFGIIINIVSDFLTKFKPYGFYFSAKEPKRIRLYDRFAEMIDKKTIYKFNKDINDRIDNGISVGEKYYTFTKGSTNEI